MSKALSVIVSTAITAIVCLGQASAEVNCSKGLSVPVKGKITNMAISQTNTLGVVALKFGIDREKTKCALLGLAAPASPGEVAGIPIAFTHTIVCDDKEPDFPFSEERVHSQVVLATTGVGNFVGCDSNKPDLPPFFGPFLETSVPLFPGYNLANRGKFSGISGGEITIRGNLFCNGRIDMKFEGEACLP